MSALHFSTLGINAFHDEARRGGFRLAGPGFFVGFVALTVLFEVVDGEPHHAYFKGWTENHRCGDEVPDVHRNDVGGEEVDFFERIALLGEVVAPELAEISSTSADRRSCRSAPVATSYSRESPQGFST